MMHDDYPKRRNDDRFTVEFEVVDDDQPNTLTVSEIKELKRLARMSKTARAFTVFAIGIVSAFGLPTLLEFFRAHWK